MDYYYCPSLLKLLQYLWVSAAQGSAARLSSRLCLSLGEQRLLGGGRLREVGSVGGGAG